MTKVNSEDFGQPVMTGEPLTPESMDLPDEDGAYGFRFHDRQDIQYRVLMCRSDVCTGQHAVLLAGMPIEGVGTVTIIDMEIPEPSRFGPQPTTQDEALKWVNTFIQQMQDLGRLLQGKPPIVMEPHEG